MENYYHLTQRELGFLSKIDKPIFCRGYRLSRPAVVVRSGSSIMFVWTLTWFRKKVKEGFNFSSYTVEIYSMY